MKNTNFVKKKINKKKIKKLLVEQELLTLPEHLSSSKGLQEKLCKAEQDCFGARGQTETSFKILDLRFNKTTGIRFHKCFISCAAECLDNINFIQSSDKHNQLMQQGVI